MHKIIVSNLVSLDGMLAGPDGELDWFRADEEFLGYARDLCRSIAGLLFGRRTFEMMAAYWPTEEAIRGDPVIAERMNGLPKAVGSTHVVVCIGSSMNCGKWVPVSGYTNRRRGCDIQCRVWGRWP